MLELLNGLRLLLRIRLEGAREAACGACVTVWGTGVSGKDVTDEIVMIH